jgi:hypothetical protein
MLKLRCKSELHSLGQASNPEYRGLPRTISAQQCWAEIAWGKAHPAKEWGYPALKCLVFECTVFQRPRQKLYASRPAVVVGVCVMIGLQRRKRRKWPRIARLSQAKLAQSTSRDLP